MVTFLCSFNLVDWDAVALYLSRLIAEFHNFRAANYSWFHAPVAMRSFPSQRQFLSAPIFAMPCDRNAANHICQWPNNRCYNKELKMSDFAQDILLYLGHNLKVI